LARWRCDMSAPAATHDARTADAIWRTLRIVFGVVPIVAGLDKFTNLLVDWQKYLAPRLAQVVPAHAFMLAVGIIEIIAGIGVLFTPWTKAFATIVGLWLLGIAVDLVIGGFYDIAVRDAVMAVSSFCLARLTAPATVEQRAGRATEAHA
ncbi:MAG TPA: DoxX family membrane protein, partial [Myxococcales bacterium]|nr:DoxX family membrane protein [Myxococcales bacterium]